MPCCQSSEAGYIVLKRACSVFKRPHKTLTVLPLFTLTPQSTQKHEIPGRRKPRPSFYPVLTLLSLPCHITSFSDHRILSNIIFARFYFPFCNLLSSAFSSLGFHFLQILIFSFCPHQNPGRGSLEHSRIAHGEHLCVPECWQCMPLFVNTVQCVHGFLDDYRENVFGSSHQISSSLSLQISHPSPHQRD